MKTWRPHKAGFIVLYALSALSLADFVYGIYRQLFTAHDTVYDSFSTFNYVIFVLVILYLRMYVPSRVQVSDKTLRIAHPLYIKPAEGTPRAMFLYRSGELDMKFMDKTIALDSITRWGWIEDLGCSRADKSPTDENNKFLPVHEIAFYTSENKRYHLNGGFFTKKQLAQIVPAIRSGCGVDPEGRLAEYLHAAD